nr:immunoglobulin heavy chain junction region [Macaca mulatta]
CARVTYHNFWSGSGRFDVW